MTLQAPRSRYAASDRAFVDDLAAGRLAPAAFDHVAHLRLAYVLLCEHDRRGAHEAMSAALRAFLAHHALDVGKVSVTITRAWILAVAHFMDRHPGTVSADDFLSKAGVLQDAAVMLTHYSPERLFSPVARHRWVAPDLDPIPGA